MDSQHEHPRAGNKSYAWDEAGRATSTTTLLSWNSSDAQKQITYPSLATNTFATNGMGARMSKVDSQGTHSYSRAGASVLAPVLSDGFASYVPGLSETRSGSTTTFHSGIKNVDRQTNSGQGVFALRTYDAFGNITASSGTWKGQVGYGGTAGYWPDAQSGLVLLGYRYYDPATDCRCQRPRRPDVSG